MSATPRVAATGNPPKFGWRGLRGARLLAVAGLVFLAAYSVALASPVRSFLPVLPYHVPSIVSMFLLWGRIPKAEGRERLGLILLAGMVVAWDAADWVFSWYQLAYGTEPPFPSVADPLYYIGYAFALVAIPALAGTGRAGRDRRWMLDAAMTMVVAGTLGWQFLVLPRMDAADHGAALIAVGYPVLDLGLIAIIVSAYYSQRGRLSARAAVLAAGFVLFVMADGAFATVFVRNGSADYASGLDVVWLAVNWLIALAIILPGAPQTAGDGPAAPNSLVSMYLPYAMATPLVVAVLITASFGHSPVVVAAGAVVAMALAGARQLFMLRENMALTGQLRTQTAKQAELLAALRESEHFAQTVVSNVVEGVAIYDRELRYVLCNSYLERVIGQTSAELRGRKAADTFPHVREHGIDRLLERALAGESVTTPEVAYHIPGTETSGWMEARFSPLTDSRGEITGVVGAFTEMTQRRVTQQALIQAQKMESLGVLAGGVAHDFNNLLTTILGSCSLLKLERESPARMEESIELIEGAALRGAEISHRLLSFARGGFFALTPLDLREVVVDTTRLAGPSLPPGIRVTTDLPEGAVLVDAHRGQLEQVLLNLVLNARDALGTRGTIRLAVSAGAGKATIVIEDDGPGMDEGVQLRIFEPFFTTKPAGAGSGLGLAIAYGILQQHHGDIAVESAPGDGTRFRIELPVSAA
ncbi:MAG: PAS domain-containing protein [Chloroflexi bacterium]|nr:PAS domain-containing protein [Chloroflexota bacterium]